MALASGGRLGSYEVVSAIGSGGMGEVYRARDTKLHRDVALKILPEEFAADPERRARFEREARTLASLNHPHIAQIYGVEDSGTTHALVMELVEGPTLADRIAQGAIPLDEALSIASADRVGARGRPRSGRRPPRPQAGQRQGSSRRGGESAGLRVGEGARAPRSRARCWLGPRELADHGKSCAHD